jgi:hypothetical protein
MYFKYNFLRKIKLWQRRRVSFSAECRLRLALAALPAAARCRWCVRKYLKVLQCCMLADEYFVCYCDSVHVV